MLIVQTVNYCKGVDGCGHIMSLVSSEQNSLILLYRYHCRSNERPDGSMTGGRLCCDSLQDLSESRLISFSVSSLEALTNTDPG